MCRRDKRPYTPNTINTGNGLFLGITPVTKGGIRVVMESPSQWVMFGIKALLAGIT
jgi:hypothetical protein